MRLLYLQLSGIGPFAHEERIDFRSFEDSGLFLLEGPTGAGKSTIIDAITFALYGDVARTKDASKDRLRSNHLTDNQRAYVTLVFEVSSGIYRVTREPAYLPSGRKTQRNAQATLVQVVEDHCEPDGFRTIRPIESGPSKVGPEIRSLVGLDKEQFLQTVILPQGKFSAFLTATSDEREKILRDIFNTHQFVRFQEEIARSSSSYRQAIATAEQRVSSLYTTLMSLDFSYDSNEAPSHTPDLKLPETPETDAASAVSSEMSSHVTSGAHAFMDTDVNPLASDPVEARRAVNEHSQVLNDERLRLHAQLETLDARARHAQEALVDAQRVASIIAEWRELNERQAALRQQDERIARMREQVTQAQKAASIVSLIETVRRGRTSFEESHTHLTLLREQVVSDVVTDSDSVSIRAELFEPVTADCDVTATRHAIEEYRAELRLRHSRLSQLLELEQQLPNRVKELDEQRRTLEHDQDSLTQLEMRSSTLPEHIHSARQSVELMRQDAEQLPLVEREYQDLLKKLDASQRADLLRADLAQRAQQLSDSIAEAKVVHVMAQNAHDRWLQHTASVLSAELEDNSPCPVCGSLEHPHPTLPPDEAITRNEVDEFDKALRAAEDRAHQARMEHTRTVDAIASLNDIAGGDTASIELRLSDVRTRMTQLEQLESKISQLTRDIESVEDQLRRDRDEISALRVSIATQKVTVDRDQAAIDADRARIDEARDGSSSLQSMLDEYERHEITLKALLESYETWASNRRSLLEASRELDAALLLGDFPPGLEGESRALSVSITPERLRELTEDITHYDRELHTVSVALAAEKFTDAARLTPPDIEAMQVALADSVAQRDEARRRFGAFEQFVLHVRTLCTELDDAWASLAATRQSAGPIRRLSDIANARSAENLLHTPLASWVLVSRLDEVLAATNPRLASFSSGRYELLSVPDDGTQSRRSGLGLTVLDHDTEVQRSPRTLSGGETFYTSLALALGLADVVSAEAGGIELHTMFIDEGFGSLDAHTLELVMTQLHQLRASGRCVGVISHVEEMAQQISDQIQVRPLPDGGSRITIRS